MNLTPTEKLHYDAIINRMAQPEVGSNHINKAAQACARITEQEKLKAIEKFINNLQSDVGFDDLTESHHQILNKYKKGLQQQLNELTR